MKIPLIIILSILAIFPIPQGAMYVDSEYIERNEIPKDLGLNVLEIYNFKNKPLLFFDGYHQRGVIYFGDFSDIHHIYDFNSLDFILVQQNKDKLKAKNLILTKEISSIELLDDDNSLKVIDDTILLELKRFKFIISNNLQITKEVKQWDAQFFVLQNIDAFYEMRDFFSVEQVFLIGENQYESDHNITVIPKKFFVQFICNESSYKFYFRQY